MTAALDAWKAEAIRLANAIAYEMADQLGNAGRLADRRDALRAYVREVLP